MRALVENVTLTVLSRLAMIVASTMLPVAGWLLIRSVNTIDRVSDKIDQTNIRLAENAASIRIIETTMQLHGQLLADHEARVRSLERFQPARPALPPP